MESNPNIESQNSDETGTDNKFVKDALVTQSTSSSADDVKSKTLKTLQIKESANEIASVLDFFRHCYSQKGKQITLSDKTQEKLEEKGSRGRKQDEDLTELLKINVLEDNLLQVPPQILIAIMGSKLSFQWKNRFASYVSQSLQYHPMLNTKEYKDVLLAADPDLDQLFRKLTASISRFNEQQNFVEDRPERLSPEALKQLRRNSVTIFLLILSIKQKWSTEKFITCFNKYYLDTRHQVDVAKELPNIASLAKQGSTTGTAIVAKVLLRQINSLNQDLLEAGRKIESNYLRALNAEDEVGKATETIGERDLTISGLEIQISQLTMEIAHRETAILNAATHHIDDYDAIRTRVLRMLGTQVDLLTDGLHALRKDNREVAEEFMERTISSLNRELENLRISREVGD